MNSIVQQRCFHHREREAAARCPQCGRFFCRECVTEHEDRAICAECLAALERDARKPRTGLRAAAVALLPVAGFTFAWWLFYALGRLLILIPSAVHEGTLWRAAP